MSEPIIDPEWNNGNDESDFRSILAVGVPLIIIVVSLVLSFEFIKGNTSLGRLGRQNVYSAVQQDGKGFVGKANNLLEKLLADCDPDIQATDLKSLNQKYRALTFELPYSESSKSVIDATDLRLVGINAEQIKDPEDRLFFYNSRLPLLLSQQEENKEETLFKIKFQSGKEMGSSHIRPIEISKIEVIPGMFKVALSKDPWVGVIESNVNSLFPESKYVFLSFGNSVLPLRKGIGHQMAGNTAITYRACIDEAKLLRNNGLEVDLYDHFKALTGNMGAYLCNVSIRKELKSKELANFTISCDSSTVRILSSKPVKVYRHLGETVDIAPNVYSGSVTENILPMEDGLKFVVYSDQGEKYGEYTLNTHDPTKILSCLIQTNVGRQRYTLSNNMTDLFTQQLVRGVSRNMSNSYNIDTVRLSVDPLLSRQLEKELESYLKQHVRASLGAHSWQTHEIYDISLTVMDMATGDVIATPFFTTRFDDASFPEKMHITTRNPALIRRFIGSTFKPMVALAAVQANPKLLNMSTHQPHDNAYYSFGENEAIFFGHRVNSWGKKTQRHWLGTSFTDFLAHSDDVYPVALATLAMTGKDISAQDVLGKQLPVNDRNNFLTISGGKLAFKKSDHPNAVDIKTHPFTSWLSYLYAANLNSELPTDTLFRNLNREYQDPESRQFGLDEVSFDPTDLRLESFTLGGNLRSELTPWILGQRDNEWSCIKLAEAWSRMLTKRDVKASFVKGSHTSASLVDGVIGDSPAVGFVYKNPTSRKIHETWNGFLEKFSEAQKPGHGNRGNNTLVPMYNTVAQLNAEKGINLRLFSKTGTPDAYTRSEFTTLGSSTRQLDIGLYTFALMSDAHYQDIREGKPGHGLVCVVRVTRSFECKDCRPGHQCDRCANFDGVSSTHARNLFAGRLEFLKKFYELTRNYY